MELMTTILRDQRRLLLYLAIAGLFVRLFLAAISIGTNDSVNWYISAISIREYGLLASYARDLHLNNPPLISLLAAGTLWFSELSHIPFFFLHKVISILGEVGSFLVLWRIFSKHASEDTAMNTVILFGWSLASIVISGYEGHTDGLCGFLSLLALFLFSERSSRFSSAIVLGVAINVKLIPVFLIPALFFQIRDNKGRFLFISGLALMTLPFMVTLLMLGRVFYERVLAYRSILDYWGIQLFLMLGFGTYPNLKTEFATIIRAYYFYGPYLMLVAVVVFAWIMRNRLSAYQLASGSFALFAILASGFGISYFGTFLPIMFAASPKWASRISLMAGISLIIIYAFFMVQWFPLQSYHYRTIPKLAMFTSFLAWLTTLCYFLSNLTQKPVDQTLS